MTCYSDPQDRAETIERLRHHDPVLKAAFEAAKSLGLDDKATLELAVIALSDSRLRVIEDMTEKLRSLSHAPFIVKPKD